MSFQEKIDGTYTIKSLSRQEFERNSSYYQQSFNEITLSQFPHIKIDDNSENFTRFFKLHPINSIVYIKEGKKIVAYMYASPMRDYEAYDGTDLEHWAVNYIKTHKSFEGKGYAYLLTIAGLQDMAKKGAKRVDFLPNQKSLPILIRVINNNSIGQLIDSYRIGAKTIIFNDSFINRNYLLNNHEHVQEI